MAKRERAVDLSYDSSDTNEGDSFCMIDPYETCKDESDFHNDNEYDGYVVAERARAQNSDVARPRKCVRLLSSDEKRFILKPSLHDRYMLWFNDFSKVDGQSANGEQLFDLYIMTCVRSNNISAPIDENTNQNTILTHTAMHIIRANKSGQITKTQYQDFIRVIHDYRNNTPARKMVEYIVRIHRCNTLLIGRIFGVFRALSKSAAAAYLHCLLSSCSLDQYNLSLEFIIKMCSVVIHQSSLARILDWIKTTHHPSYREYQTIPFSKLCSTILYGLVIYEPAVYTCSSISKVLLSSIHRHYMEETNNILTRSGIFDHVDILESHGFPFVQLIALEHMVGMLSKEGLALMSVRPTLDIFVYWCIVHQSSEYGDLADVLPICNKLVSRMYNRVSQRVLKIQPDNIHMLESTSKLIKRLEMCK